MKQATVHRKILCALLLGVCAAGWAQTPYRVKDIRHGPAWLGSFVPS